MLTKNPSSPTTLGLILADKLNGSQGYQEQQAILKRLHEIQHRLLNQTRGEGAESALVNGLDSESFKMAQFALSTVRHAIDIMDNVEIPSGK